MQTRSSPSMTVLHSLARVAGLGAYAAESKPTLYGRLKTQYDLQRLERVRDRGLKRRALSDAPTSEDDDEPAAALPPRRGARLRGGPLASSSAVSAAACASSSSPAAAAPRAGSPAAQSAAAAAGTPERCRLPAKAKLRAKLSVKYALPAAPLVDPVMLTPLVPGEATWTFARPSSNAACPSGKAPGNPKGKAPAHPPPSSPVVYSAASLVDYLLASGDFCEPETRLPFGDADLQSLDAAAQAAGLGKPSVLAAKRDKARYAELAFRRDALAGLERCAGELVADMVALVEAEDDPEEGQVRLCASLFPPFADLVAQMRAADAAHAHAALGHFAAFCEGPPNRRTRDRSGCLLPVVRTFIRELQAGGQSWFGY